MPDHAAMDPPGDPRFFSRCGPFSLTEIARAIDAPPPVVSGDRLFRGVAPLQSAGPEEVSFLDNLRYQKLLAETRAGAVILLSQLANQVPSHAIALTVAEPYLAWARACSLFHPPPEPIPGVHPTAIVDPSAEIDPMAEVGAFAIIGPRVKLGHRSVIGPHSVIGAGVVIGANCRVGGSVTISHTLLGERITIHEGARIGQDGFGFASSPMGFVSVPQLGRVIIENDVHIGANTTIDRGSSQDTIIGAGTRIDNQVQIGHNARVGKNCIVVAQAGISGSTVLGDSVVVAGQAGLSGHLTIGNGARIGPQAGVMANVPAGADVLGSPAQPVKAFFREVAALRRFARRDGMRHSESEADTKLAQRQHE